MNRRGGKLLQLNPVRSILSVLLLCSTISAQLNDPSSQAQPGEDFKSGSNIRIEEERPPAAHEATGQTTEPFDAGRYTDKLLDLKGPASTDSLLSLTVNQGVDLTTVAPHSLQKKSAPGPTSPVPLVGSNYTEDMFISEEFTPGWVILYILGIIYTFVSLVTVCDKFFVPSLEVIGDKLAISDDVAGATFMAAGRYVPNLAAFFLTVDSSSWSVEMSSVADSAVFRVLYVTAMCALFSREVLHLSRWPLFRDMSFYLIGLVLLIALSGVLVTWWGSVTMVGCCVLYCIFLKYNTQARRAFKTQLRKHRTMPKAPSEEKSETEYLPAGGSVDGEEDDGSNTENEGVEVGVEDDEVKPLSLQWFKLLCQQIIYLLLLPLIWPLWLIFPDVHSQSSRRFFVMTYLVSSMWLGVFFHLILWLAFQVGQTFTVGAPLHLVGALMSSPDLITSVIVARKGKGDMAVSSNVGENIFDITLVLPLLCLLHLLIHGAPHPVVMSGFYCASVLHFLMLVFAVVSISVCKWRLNKVLGVVMLLVFFLFLVVSIMMQHKAIRCPI
ncbi:sodium/potassium/calcium exchanger 2-like [Kryptolebias marmoratus]|uniref:Sodium/potassium/calcium exchanger 1 n=1 Tax=Kryptolebias marmoratus TaxID=37003 RepID=A0A3Q3B8N5_KRYMA|nr:sodium/potassium/calcium exchanger 2-like [Kryptolebias marmoratus]XP_037834042.1 sodium/potassium/calcium exchanger 2-like [Kryptolebias marmoratus]